MRRVHLFATATIVLGINLAVIRPANAVDYNCVPLEVAVLNELVHDECASPAPKTRGGYPTDTGHSIK
jgi:hypothetical protein